MKKLFLLLCWPYLIVGLQLPTAAGVKKRPAAAGSEEIEILAEAEEASVPAKQPRHAKKVYTLKVPVPGTAVTIDEALNIDEAQDTIAAESIAESLEETKKAERLFVLARVPTNIEGKNHVEYYEASNLHKALFRNPIGPQDPNTINKYNLRTPNRALIDGNIYYYFYNPIIDSFVYLGTDRELFTEAKTVGKKIYEMGVESEKRKDSTGALYALKLYRFAYQTGYDLASVALVMLSKPFILNWNKARPELKPKVIEFINNFVREIRNKPAEFLLKVFPENFSAQMKYNEMNTLLNGILKLDIPNELKEVIQLKLAELQKLA